MNLYILDFDDIHNNLLTQLLKDMFDEIYFEKQKTINNNQAFFIAKNKEDIPNGFKNYLLIGSQNSYHSVSTPLNPNALKQKIVQIIKSNSFYEGDKFTIKDGFIIANNDKAELTEKEQELLLFLLNQPNYFASSEDILKNIWDYSNQIQTNTLKTHIYNLRQKFENTNLSDLIQTEENGYRLKF